MNGDPHMRNALRCAASLTALAFPYHCYAAPEETPTDDLTGVGPVVGADVPKAVGSEASDLLAELRAMRHELAEQRQMIQQQNAIIMKQQLTIDTLRAKSDASDNGLAMLRGTGMEQAAAQAASNNPQKLPSAPVGEAPPPEPGVEQLASAVPVSQGVLTPKGKFTLETSFEYTNSSANRLVFRGFELIPGLQVGLIEASDVDRDAIIGTVAGRYGITDRLEVEARMPVMYRSDRIKVTQLRDQGIVRAIKLDEYNYGDAELSLRYQATEAKGPDKPIWIANLRVKSDTGKSPFAVGFDSFGVATGLPTGSGFWGIQPGVSFLMPSDPVVIYGGMSFLYHLPKNINKVIGDTFVGRVDPGDAASANLGFGFALNQRFSFSLGYSHTYIFPTEQRLGGTYQRSSRLQVGAFAFGMSYRVSPKQSVNFGIELGATADAPRVSAVLRLPISF
jgi:hypothetical protein